MPVLEPRICEQTSGPPVALRPEPAARLVSLDAFRGAVMLLMASSGFGFAALSKEFPESPVWTFLARQTEHAAWAGCTLWDFIQPAFMFTVGVALPWSIAHRRARGETFWRMFGHAVCRALMLIALGVLLTSAWSQRTEWYFTNVLAQIGLGYPFLFLLAFSSRRSQWMAAFLILFAYWLAFALYPKPSWPIDDPTWQSIGVPANWPHLTGFQAHWEKSANIASAFDRWFLNLFPRDKIFTHSTGGYQTFNFLPSLATMIFGLLTGGLLQSPGRLPDKLKRLSAAGAIALLLGALLAATGACPMIKRVWTPSWALYSGGIVALVLAGFVAVFERRGAGRCAFPLVVAGLNPLALYCLWQLTGGFVRGSLETHFGSALFQPLGPVFIPLFQRIWVLLIFWLVLLWLYRRKIFLRL